MRLVTRRLAASTVCDRLIQNCSFHILALFPICVSTRRGPPSALHSNTLSVCAPGRWIYSPASFSHQLVIRVRRSVKLSWSSPRPLYIRAALHMVNFPSKNLHQGASPNGLTTLSHFLNRIIHTLDILQRQQTTLRRYTNIENSLWTKKCQCG